MKNGDQVFINGVPYTFQYQDALCNLHFQSNLQPSLTIPDVTFHKSRTIENCYRILDIERYTEMKETKFVIPDQNKEQSFVDSVESRIPNVTKDSGQRTTFSSGMVRDTQDGKLMWHAIFDGPMAYRWAALLTRGKLKYPDSEDGEANWLKASGIAEWIRFRCSAMRHFVMWFIGCKDEDHAAGTFFNMNGAEYVEQTLSKEQTDKTYSKWHWLVKVLT
jgi:hypothetical protein